VKRLVELQDLLGLHQDADVAIGRLRSMVVERGQSLSPGTIFAMGMVARRYGEQSEQLRSQFPKLYKRLSGKRWNALHEEMERRRPSAPPTRVLHSVESVTAVPRGSTVTPERHGEQWNRPQGIG
jgi:hypothetical protein